MLNHTIPRCTPYHTIPYHTIPYHTTVHTTRHTAESLGKAVYSRRHVWRSLVIFWELPLPLQTEDGIFEATVLLALPPSPKPQCWEGCMPTYSNTNAPKKFNIEGGGRRGSVTRGLNNKATGSTYAVDCRVKNSTLGNLERSKRVHLHRALPKRHGCVELSRQQCKHSCHKQQYSSAGSQ